jgi:peptidoglycan/xylan/chitin deacetylase (PgdA/CDA1 family)
VRIRVVLAIAGPLCTAALLGTSAGAARSPATPFSISSAALVQDGRQLSWRVAIAGHFSIAGLASGGRGLCLVVERPRPGTVFGELCLAPSATARGSARLVYSRVTAAGPGPAVPVAATITRAGVNALVATFTPASFDPSYRSIRWQVLSTVRARGCLPQGPVAGRCVIAVPSRPVLAKLHTPVLIGCAPSGPSLVYQGSPKVHEIALTFDDGPWTQPPSVDFLKLLKRYHVPATFFEIGGLVIWKDVDGSIERQMLADDDMIGNHTWSHPDMTKLPASQQRSQLELAAASIRKRTGFTPCLWRPPYGAINPTLVALARSLGYLTIMWDVDPRDWASPGVGVIERNVISGAHNGAIVELHFGGGPRYETFDALPDIISTLRARGYRFVTLTQMLGLRLLYR